jgi:vacuolar-type H+-ATPase subunit E/Vma4
VSGAAGPLLDQIRRTAVATATDLVAAARTEVDAIRAGARDRAQRRRAHAVADHERAAAAALSRTRAETAARVGHDSLGARAAALDRIFVAAEEQFALLARHPGLGTLLAATISDGLTYLPPGPATVRCAAAIAEPVRAALATARRTDAALAAAERIDASVRLDESVPIGVMIEAGDGSVVVDGTLARRLARERPRLSAILAGRLLEHPE